MLRSQAGTAAYLNSSRRQVTVADLERLIRKCGRLNLKKILRPIVYFCQIVANVSVKSFWYCLR